MATVAENATWESGIYQLETADPVMAGPDGISNLQAKQLANRTKYLKQTSDEVIAARGTQPSLDARLDAAEANIAGLGPDMQNMVAATLKYAIDQAAVANDSIAALQKVKQQEGAITFVNDGIITGCALTKNATGNRSLSLSMGKCFMEGRVYYVPANANSLSVPGNNGASSAVVYAYLYIDANGIAQLGITNIGDVITPNLAKIYSITVPAGNTVANDPNLANVTLTDLRRIEPLFPMALDAPVSISVPINSLPDVDYRLSFEIVSYLGAPVSPSDIKVSSRATNGFTVQLISTSDDVVVLWRLSRLADVGEQPIASGFPSRFATDSINYPHA